MSRKVADEVKMQMTFKRQNLHTDMGHRRQARSGKVLKQQQQQQQTSWAIFKCTCIRVCVCLA